jgi:hypothetical protein
MLLTFLFFFMRAAANNVSLLLSSQYLSQSLRLSAVPIRRAHFLLLLRPQPPSSESGRRTLGILAPADLDELLDVGNFGRHLDDLCVDGSLEFGIVKFGDEFGQCRCPGVDELASNARATKGCPQALLLWAWWGDDVRGVNQEGSGKRCMKQFDQISHLLACSDKPWKSLTSIPAFHTIHTTTSPLQHADSH